MNILGAQPKGIDMNRSMNSKADRAPRTRDLYLTELDSETYWEILSLFATEEGMVVCGRPPDEEAGHTHGGEQPDWEWIAPLVEIEVG